MIPVKAAPSRKQRGMVIGELLVAVLLLAVAVSSLAALMYSVSQREEGSAKVECVAGSKAVNAKCVSDHAIAGANKLVKSATNTLCAGESAVLTRECRDSEAGRSGGTVIKGKTDSASVALIGKKERESKKKVRTDLGFVR
jgi:Tfp pilus assembly protein PilV